jgi:excisionase family DNA binding protein
MVLAGFLYGGGKPMVDFIVRISPEEVVAMAPYQKQAVYDFAGRLKETFTSGAAPEKPSKPHSMYLTVHEAAVESGFSDRTIHRAISDGSLPANQPRGTRNWRIHRHHFKAWMEDKDSGSRSLGRPKW